MSEIEFMRMEESAAIAQYLSEAEPYKTIEGMVTWNEAVAEASLRMGYTDCDSVPLEWWRPILREAEHIKFHGKDVPYFGSNSTNLLRRVDHWIFYNFERISTCWVMDDFGNLVGLDFSTLFQFIWVFWMDGTLDLPH